jgi:hypothetical protein
MQKLGLLVVIAGVAATLGCAHGESYVPDHSRSARGSTVVADLGPVPSGSAQVCVVRPDSMAAQVSMLVRDNGRLVGATRGTTFFCYLARAGEHQITSPDDDTGPTLLRAVSGARYWLHQEVTELAGSVHAHLDWVDENTALELLDACESRVHVAVPGHEDETAAQPIAPAKKM